MFFISLRKKTGVLNCILFDKVVVMSLKKKPRRKRSVVCRSGHYIEDLIMLPMRSIQRPKQEHTDRWVPIHIQIAEID